MPDIVVIDDDKIIRVLLEDILTSAGHSVRLTCNGAEAVRSVDEKEPDVVITDIFMPEKTGLETIIELRTRHPNVRIIAMSGDTISRENAHSECLRLARCLGSKVILEKPFSKTQILDALEITLKAE
jgi:CheY-like chemotaxis protein